jgi:hypothetical protein
MIMVFLIVGEFCVTGDTFSSNDHPYEAKDPDLWVINSIGDVATRRGDYEMALLTTGSPSMPYGINTVESVATLINQALASS